jgi:protein-S-isoprenylcysteine O-methyltransferase Ste14
LLILLASGANPVWAAILCLFIIAGAIAFGDLWVVNVARRPGAGLGALRPSDGYRVLIKLAALYVTLGLVAGAYALLLPLAPGRFSVFLMLLPFGLGTCALLAPLYFVYIDRRMIDPCDAYWHVGQLLVGKLEDRDWRTIRTFVLGWIIKGFFLPIMASALFAVAVGLSRHVGEDLSTPLPLFRLSFELILFVDLAVAVLGYILTLRVLDTHIRSCNPFWYGWVVTIVCYYPFWGILYPNLLGYEDGDVWSDWLAGAPAFLVVWGSLILVAKLAWIWANVTFGLRFSNLTHRGILTNGPFRFTKHPSYVSKNLAWWLISLPFLSTQGWQEALPNCAALLFVNAIYYARAKVEERHLMEDPVYVAYAAWIERNGIFPRLRRLLLGGRFSAAANRI